jgi:hypothetical protein
MCPVDEQGLHGLESTAALVWQRYGQEVLAPLIITTAYLGLELVSVRALEWADVSDSAITVRETPKHAKREVQLVPEVKAALARVPRLEGTPRVFTNQKGSPLTVERLFYYWMPIRAAFGRPDLELGYLRFFRPRQRAESTT